MFPKEYNSTLEINQVNFHEYQETVELDLARVFEKLHRVTGIEAESKLSEELFGHRTRINDWKTRGQISGNGFISLIEFCIENQVSLDWLFFDMGTPALLTGKDELAADNVKEYQIKGDLSDLFSFVEFAEDQYEEYRRRLADPNYDMDEETYLKHMKVLKWQIASRAKQTEPA